MDSTHLHLILNHFPIIGTLIGTGVMVFAYLYHAEPTKKAALWIWVVMAVIAIPVFLTGEPAEETVEGLAGVSETMIEQHEEAAQIAIWLMEALGVFSLVALFAGFRYEVFTKTMTSIALVLSLITFGMMARTGYLGGQIRHTEIRKGQSETLVPGETGEVGGGNADENDD